MKRRAGIGGMAVALGALLLLGAWLRWQYAQTISLYVDEFTTLWAARRTLEQGAPLMPSGVLYTRGLLATYVTALAGALAGLDYISGRAPSIFFGLATIVAIFAAGRREWNARVGWLAAVGLALLPEAIVWSGRARFYAQLQFFVLLTLWAALWAMDEGRGPRSRRRHLIFAVLFLLALFSQEETVLLYPPIVLAMIVWHGWRYLLQREVWPAQAIILAGMALRFAVEIMGQPGFFETIQAERPYVGLILDVAAAWPAYAGLLVTPERLAWTLPGLLAVGVALRALARSAGRVAAVHHFHRATLFFAGQFAFVLIFILTLVGGQWRETRYLFLVQTCWLLVGAAGMAGLVERLLPRAAWRWAATAALAVLLAWLSWAPAHAVLARQVEGYDRVFEFVAGERRPGDVVISPQPPACAFVLGEPCDYYAVQRIYEEFVIPRNGVLVDRWSGAPLLDNAATLAELLRRAPRVWLVTDAFRLATRYENDFQRTVIAQFDPAFTERGVTALLAQGWREPPAYTVVSGLAQPLPFGRLALTSWRATQATAGTALQVELAWQATAPIDTQLNTSLRLIAPDGTTAAQQDGPPAHGIIPTHLFFDAPLPDAKTLALPATLAPGDYRLAVVVYAVDGGTVEAGPLEIGTVSLAAADE